MSKSQVPGGSRPKLPKTTPEVSKMLPKFDAQKLNGQGIKDSKKVTERNQEIKIGPKMLIDDYLIGQIINPEFTIELIDKNVEKELIEELGLIGYSNLCQFLTLANEFHITETDIKKEQWDNWDWEYDNGRKKGRKFGR
jgi:hypothetical protein